MLNIKCIMALLHFCARLNHELPDIVDPYKRYEADTIAQALQEPDQTMQACGCENSTLLCWKLWFFLLRDYMEGAIRSLLVLFGAVTSVNLPPDPLQHQPEGWLRSLVRSLINKMAPSSFEFFKIGSLVLGGNIFLFYLQFAETQGQYFLGFSSFIHRTAHAPLIIYKS